MKFSGYYTVVFTEGDFMDFIVLSKYDKNENDEKLFQ